MTEEFVRYLEMCVNFHHDNDESFKITDSAYAKENLMYLKAIHYINELYKNVEKNYTIEQNAGENQIEGGTVSISGSVKDKHYIPFSFNCGLINYCGTKNIWVKSKFDSNCVLQITGYTVDYEGKHCVWLTDSWITLEKLFDDFVFLDDSPCGVKV